MNTGTSPTLDDELARLFRSEPAVLGQAQSVYDELREEHRVYPFDNRLLVTRYEDVRSLTRDGVRTSRRTLFEGTRANAVRAALPPEGQLAFDRMAEFQGRQVSRSDGEVHARLRRIAHRAFTPRRVSEMRETIQRFTDELIAESAQSDVTDIMDIAYRLPLMVICDMMGVSDEEQERVREWGNRIARHLGAGPEPELWRDAYAAMLEYREFVADIVARHRKSPAATSDLVAALFDANEGERLDEDELTAMFVVLLFAGHETTTNLIAIGQLEMLRNADQWRSLVQRPELAGNATDELLRWVSPVQWNGCLIVEEFELGGVTFSPGQTVTTMVAAANRDPRAFDRADELDITREDARKHVALGFGPHFCLGASLARMEGEIVFRTFAERFPDMQLAADAEGLEWRGNSQLRTLVGVPVHLGRDRAAR